MNKEEIVNSHPYLRVWSDENGTLVCSVEHTKWAMEQYANQNQDFWKPICTTCNEVIDKCKCDQQKEVSDEEIDRLIRMILAVDNTQNGYDVRYQQIALTKEWIKLNK